MDVAEHLNGEGGPTVHCLPQTPKNAGALKECVQLKAGEDYLLDGRVKDGKIGCSWKAEGIDVDASLAVYDGNHKCLDVIWWDKTHSHYVSAKHLHDDRDGKVVEGTDVNEIIAVKLADVPAAVHHIVVTVNVYSKGKTLKDVSDICMKFTHIDEGFKDQDLFKFCTGSFDTAAAVVGKFSRTGPWWSFTAIGEEAVGRTVKEVVYNMTLDKIVNAKSVPIKDMKVYAWVTEGKNLAASDYSMCGPRTSDCFVEIKFKEKRSVSEVIMKNLNPKWNMPKIELATTNEADYEIVEFDVWDHDTNSPDDFLGSALVAMGGVCQKGPGSHVFELELGQSRNPDNKPKKGVKISGSITVNFEVVEVNA